MNTTEELAWTNELPKEVGVFCRRHHGKEKILCFIIRRDGEFRVVQSKESEFGTPLKWFNPQNTEWCGPLNPVAPKKKEVCPICGYPSSSIDCHKWWEGV